jgi:hypothetical protein
MLSQALYWTKRSTHKDQWFYKTQREWEEETGMGRHEQDTARKKLRDTGFWKEELHGVPATLWFRVDIAKLNAVLQSSLPDSQFAGIRQTGLPESGKLDCENPANKKRAKRQTNTEITTETTTETTTERGAADAARAPATHPAILVFDELKFARPPKRLLPLIEDAGIDDLDLWREAVRQWMGHNYNPTNVIGMLDWYQHPDKYEHNGNSAQRKGPVSFAQQSMDNVNRVLGLATGGQNGQQGDSPDVVRRLLGAAG